MLQQVLSLVAEGNVVTQKGLADILGVSEPLIQQMLTQLVRQGYLEEDALCSDGCAGCAARAACGTERHLRMWTLTQKGERAIGRTGA